MDPLALPLSNGLNTATDELRTDPGWLRLAQGAYYKPDDKDRLWKQPGRTLTSSAPSALSPKDIAFLQYDGTDVLVALANATLYEAAASQSIVGWTTAKDANGAAFSRAGNWLRTLHDGQNRWMVWSGTDAEFPLVREVGGEWRKFGLRKPGAFSAAFITSTQTVTRAQSSISGDFTSPSLAFDGGPNGGNTFSYGTARTGVNNTKTHKWSFNGAGGTTSGQHLSVKLATSGLPIDSDGSGGKESFSAEILIEYSLNSGSSWSTMSLLYAPVTTQTLSLNLTDGLTINNIQVRATVIVVEGNGTCTLNIYDIYLATSGGDAILLPGTYYYTITEVYLGPDGTEVESAYADPISVTVTGSEVAPNIPYAVALTLPARANLTDEGFVTARLSRRVYRSTSTGAPPDMGLVATIPSINDTTWTDIFDISETALAPVPLQVVSVGDVSYPRDSDAPAVWDAVMFNGTIVVIPVNDRYRIRWSMPGRPESWPVIHDLVLTSTDRNDPLLGLAVNGDWLLAFSRTQVFRIPGLPYADQTTFDPDSLNKGILSSVHGLAASPEGICQFVALNQPFTAWVSDEGIFATDASYIQDRGYGIVQLTVNLDWVETVDKAQLSLSRLTYDVALQALIFDYLDLAGNWKSLWLHVAPLHWVEGPAGKVPKITGPHTIGNSTHHLLGRTVGELSGQFLQWSIGSDGRVWNENTGEADGAVFDSVIGDITTEVRTGWIYPAGPRGWFHLYTGQLFHSNWGGNQLLQLNLEFRDDDTGVVQYLQKRGLSLLGSRITPFWVSRAGRSVRATLIHTGQASGALGPVVFDGSGVRKPSR